MEIRGVGQKVADARPFEFEEKGRRSILGAIVHHEDIESLPPEDPPEGPQE
jgi:hypothetical protein